MARTARRTIRSSRISTPRCWIAASTREPVGRLVALGVTALVATQVLVNVGMVVGLIPVVGIPLPFMSYGGSSMVVSMMALGLLLSVRMRQFQ